MTVEIQPESGGSFSAIVTNLSAHGMGARSDAGLKLFDTVVIIKRGFGSVSGEVRWTNGQNFGVLFSKPISVDLFNFADHNERGHFIQPVDNGHIWKGYDVDTSMRRPGVTSQFSGGHHDL